MAPHEVTVEVTDNNNDILYFFRNIQNWLKYLIYQQTYNTEKDCWKIYHQRYTFTLDLTVALTVVTTKSFNRPTFGKKNDLKLYFQS